MAVVKGWYLSPERKLATMPIQKFGTGGGARQAPIRHDSLQPTKSILEVEHDSLDLGREKKTQKTSWTWGAGSSVA